MRRSPTVTLRMNLSITLAGAVAASSCAPSSLPSSTEPVGVESSGLFGEEMQGTQLVGDALGSATTGKDGIHYVDLARITVVAGTLGPNPTAVVGTIGQAVLFNQGSVTIRIDSAEPANTSLEAVWDVGGDAEHYWAKVPNTWLYEVSMLRLGQWVPFCNPYTLTGVDGGAPQSTKAVPIDEYWDEDGTARPSGGSRITLACLSGVAAKCYKWGYVPWLNKEMVDVHWACTRAARADYCGTGLTGTKVGTAVDVYDRFHVRIHDAWDCAGLKFEDGWGTAGARCMTHWRYRELAPDGGPLCKPNGATEAIPPFCDTWSGDAGPNALSFSKVLIGLSSHPGDPAPAQCQ